MSSFEIGLLLLLATFCVFTIISRVCSCIEHCATARAFAKSNLNVKPEDFEKHVETGFGSKNS